MAYAVLGILMVQGAFGQQARSRGGLGLAFFMAPAYPGSDSERPFVYPYPYFDYESPILHLHHEHLHAKFAPGSPWSVGFGLNGSPPADAGSPDARLDMPALPPTFAMGPNVMYRLRWRPWGLRSSLGAEIRYRTAIDPGAHLVGIGSSASGFIEWQSSRGHMWPISIGLGPVWRSRGVNNDFFGVPEMYATPWRPAYQAPGGYAGMRVTAAVTTHLGNMSFAVFGRYRNYRGAVFSASPLLKASSTFVLGIAVVWVFIRSRPSGAQ
ncbi:MAG: MipA/OmpV family protein [Acidiferrobacter sp.]